MNVQNLYRAVMILGRSMEDIKGYGWICGTIGDHIGGPKCANGILTVSAGVSHHKRPLYIYSDEVPLEMREPLVVAAHALIQNAPAEVLAEFPLISTIPPREWHSLVKLGDQLVNINDAAVPTEEHDEDGEAIYRKILNRELAYAWFERAFDKLAEQLPEPIPAEPPLTVQDIVRTPADFSEAEKRIRAEKREHALAGRS